MNKTKPHKRRHPTRTEADLARISDLYIRGQNQRSIAEVVGLSQPTISRAIKNCSRAGSSKAS